LLEAGISSFALAREAPRDRPPEVGSHGIFPGGSRKTVDPCRDRDLHQASSRQPEIDCRQRFEDFVGIAGILLGVRSVDEHEARHLTRKACGVHANQLAAE